MSQRSTVKIDDLEALGCSRGLDLLERTERPLQLSDELISVVAASVLMAGVALPVTRSHIGFQHTISQNPSAAIFLEEDVRQKQDSPLAVHKQQAPDVPAAVALEPGTQAELKAPTWDTDANSNAVASAKGPKVTSLPSHRDFQIGRAPVAERQEKASLDHAMVELMNNLPAIQAVLIEPVFAPTVPPGPTQQAWSQESLPRSKVRSIVEVTRSSDHSTASEQTASITGVSRLTRGRIETGTAVRSRSLKASLKGSSIPRVPETPAAPWTLPSLLAPSE